MPKFTKPYIPLNAILSVGGLVALKGSSNFECPSYLESQSTDTPKFTVKMPTMQQYRRSLPRNIHMENSPSPEWLCYPSLELPAALTNESRAQ